MLEINKWYVINTKPRNENLVYTLLESQSFEVFLPLIVVQGKHKRQKLSRNEEPLFPGYVFTKMDLSDPDWVQIKYTPGVRTIVSYGTQPVAVPELILEEIKVRLSGGKRAVKGAVPFRAGDRVQFMAGPFEGLEGIFTGTVSGRQRVKVLMELVRQLVQVEAEVCCLAKISAR